MTRESKRPSAAFWITLALVVLLVTYPLSFGPACWLVSRTGIGDSTLPALYRPIIELMVIGESRIELKRRLDIVPESTSPGNVPDVHLMEARTPYFPRGYVSKYACLGAPEGWSWRLEFRTEYTPGYVVRTDEGRWKWRHRDVR